VLYVGTFSKVLAPGLRLGYLILPEPLVEPFLGARTVADTHSPLILQATLAEFMEGGHLERHIAKLRGLHRERREALRQSLEERLGGALEVVAGDAGLHLTTFLPPGTDDREVGRRAFHRGVEAPPLSDYRLGSPPRPGLVLGYGAVSVGEMPRGVERLAEAVEPLLKSC